MLDINNDSDNESDSGDTERELINIFDNEIVEQYQEYKCIQLIDFFYNKINYPNTKK